MFVVKLTLGSIKTYPIMLCYYYSQESPNNIQVTQLPGINCTDSVSMHYIVIDLIVKKTDGGHIRLCPHLPSSCKRAH